MRFLCSSSSPLYFSASWTMRSISSLLSLPLSLVMVILFLVPASSTLKSQYDPGS